jgi:hypothetical protein
MAYGPDYKGAAGAASEHTVTIRHVKSAAPRSNAGNSREARSDPCLP